MELDLQSSRTIVGFELSSLDNRLSSCELQWSVDGVSWITAGTLMTTNNAATIQFPDIHARFWKLINIQSGSGWPAIPEMQFIIGQVADVLLRFLRLLFLFLLLIPLLCVSMYPCTSMCICVCVCVCINIYICIYVPRDLQDGPRRPPEPP